MPLPSNLKSFTKVLSVPFVSSRQQSVVRISSNLLRQHGFEPGTRITKLARAGGMGVDCHLISALAERIKQHIDTNLGYLF